MKTTFQNLFVLVCVWASFANVWAKEVDAVADIKIDTSIDVSVAEPVEAPDFSVRKDSVPKFIYSVGGSGGISHMMNIKMRDEKLGKRLWAGNYSIFMNSQANPLDSGLVTFLSGVTYTATAGGHLAMRWRMA